MVRSVQQGAVCQWRIPAPPGAVGSASGQFSKDSGYPGSPMISSMSPDVDVPPPFHLDKHPSFRKQRSLPCRVPK